MIVKFNRKCNPGNPDDYVLEEGDHNWAIAYKQEIAFNYHTAPNVVKFPISFKKGTQNDIKDLNNSLELLDGKIKL